MAEFITRTVCTERREYVLKHGYGSPTNWAEISKVMAAITADLRAEGRDTTTDDAVLITANDEEIIFYYETEERNNG